MTLSPQRRWSRDKLLELLDDQDIAELTKKWRLTPSGNTSNDANTFKAAIAALSDTTLMQEILLIRTNTLRMLRDVFTFLIAQQSAVRTTGSLIVLNEDFDIDPQQVNAILRWSARTLKGHSVATWDGLRERLDREIVPLFEKVDAYGAVRVTRRQENLVKAMIRMERRGSASIRKITTARYSEEGLRAREEYIAKLGEFSKKLDALRESDLPPAAKDLLREIEELFRGESSRLGDERDDIRNADETQPAGSSTHEVTQEDEEVWRQFVESVLFLSDVEEGGSAADVLRMDLFRKRPQLFEVWVVVMIIRFMQEAGCDVSLLGLGSSPTGRVAWNLNYSKSKVPIARFLRRSDQVESFLFYQLFRPGKERAEMPDIALMPSQNPSDTPLWIMDPKHSEQQGYSLSAYEEVAKRYHTAFRTKRTWIVEYYARYDLGVANPHVIADHVELITDVSPEGEGYRHLIDRLRAFYGISHAMLAIVDVSSSFIGRLERVKDDLQALLGQGNLFLDDIIWFSEQAFHSTGWLDAFARGSFAPPASIANRGTQFGPVLDVLEQLQRTNAVVLSVRVYTDGGFGDMTTQNMIELLQNRGGVKDVTVVNVDS